MDTQDAKAEERNCLSGISLKCMFFFFLGRKLCSVNKHSDLGLLLCVLSPSYLSLWKKELVTLSLLFAGTSGPAQD